MIKKALRLGVVAAVGVALVMGWQDIQRFIKIKQLSTGNMLHPEKVPASGRTVYPQSGDGAPDGTGDFDSASRGGPAGR